MRDEVIVVIVKTGTSVSVLNNGHISGDQPDTPHTLLAAQKTHHTADTHHINPLKFRGTPPSSGQCLSAQKFFFKVA